MRKLRHSLALGAISLAACISDLPWESVGDGSGSALSGSTDNAGDDAGAAPRAADDAAVPLVTDGGADIADDAGSDVLIAAGSNAVDWNTQFVKLHADDLRITVGGKAYLGQSSKVELMSDPGVPDEHTTFERRWFEHGVEMRLHIYFDADGTDWWASEIRIYDGELDAEWLTMIGEWFRSPLGQPFSGDFELDLVTDPLTRPAADGGKRGPGTLTMRSLRLQPFPTPEICLRQFSGYAIEVPYPAAELSVGPQPGFGVGVWIRDEHCKPADNDSFDFVWSVDDPKLVEISSPFRPTNAQLRGLAVGETTVRVNAKRRIGGLSAQQGTIKVTIAPARMK